MKKIMILTLLLAMAFSCQNRKPLGSLTENGVELSWFLNDKAKTLEIELLNTSNKNISIRAPKEYFEATIVVDGKERLEFYEEQFHFHLTCKSWFPLGTDLAPKESVKWSVKYSDIIPGKYQGTPFISAIENGNVSVEKFWGFKR